MSEANVYLVQNSLKPGRKETQMWDKAIEAHTRFAVTIYPPEKIKELASASGFIINADGTNSANSPEDVERYLMAAGKVLGMAGRLSAKLKINNKMKELHLSD